MKVQWCRLINLVNCLVSRNKTRQSTSDKKWPHVYFIAVSFHFCLVFLTCVLCSTRLEILSGNREGKKGRGRVCFKFGRGTERKKKTRERGGGEIGRWLVDIEGIERTNSILNYLHNFLYCCIDIPITIPTTNSHLLLPFSSVFSFSIFHRPLEDHSKTKPHKIPQISRFTPIASHCIC